NSTNNDRFISMVYKIRPTTYENRTLKNNQHNSDVISQTNNIIKTSHEEFKLLTLKTYFYPLLS
ncbi:MAG: hypothetical protein OXC62_04090, partial [Aestuariivita sp.]|nr:hypothetical protein [Aestuariivita sp.]